MTTKKAHEIAQALIDRREYKHITIQLIDTPMRDTLAIGVFDDGSRIDIKPLTAWGSEYADKELECWIMYVLGTRADL